MVGVVYIKSQQNGVTYVNEEHPHPTLSRTNFRADSESGNQSPFKKMTLKGFFHSNVYAILCSNFSNTTERFCIHRWNTRKDINGHSVIEN